MKTETNRRIFLRSLGLITFGAATGAGILAACSGKPSADSQAVDTTAVAK